MSRRHHLVLGLAAILFITLHAVVLPTTLEDEDTVNLALGVEEFDVRRYQPHPPGYPVYIALGKASTAAVAALRPDWSRDRTAASGLAWLSVLAGALGAWAVAWFWRSLEVPPTWAVTIAIVTLASPFYWFTALRPLTDVPGTVAALAVQAAILWRWRQEADGRAPAGRTAWIAIGIAAGLVLGLRSQTMWMTLPLLGWAVVRLVRLGRTGDAAQMLGAVIVGVAVWAVPLVHQSGGLTEYLNVLAGQARSDFSGVRMLATTPSWTLLKEDLSQTFLAPWQLTTVPWVVLAAVALGTLTFLRRPGPSVGWLLLATMPYLVFHVLFHEVETVRYGLPSLIVFTGLGVHALRWLATTGTIIAVSAAVVMVWQIWPVTTVYRGGAPVFLALRDIQAARDASPEPKPLLEAHEHAWWAASRAIDWYRGPGGLPMPQLVRQRESLRLVDYWRGGTTRPVQFLSDLRRTDLARFAPASAHFERAYRLPEGLRVLIAGLRQYEVGWWTLTAPTWMLVHGWSTSPDLSADTVRQRPDRALALIRKTGTPHRVLIEARHVDPQDDAAVDAVAMLDGTPVEAWPIGTGQTVTRWLTLPAVAANPTTPYAELSVHLRRTPPTRPAPVILKQFAAAPEGQPVIGFGRGWSGIEADHTGTFWRRTTAQSELWLQHGGHPVRIGIQGLSPFPEFASPPDVLVLAGTTLLARIVPDADFSLEMIVHPDVLDAAAGVLTIAADLRRTPAERAAGLPVRHYGLRITQISANTVATP